MIAISSLLAFEQLELYSRAKPNKREMGNVAMGLEQLQGVSIKGFMAEEEGLRLYELARTASKRGPCLEIGSYCGKSTAYLGIGCQEAGGVLYSIDHHMGSEEQQPGQEYFDPELFDEETQKISTLSIFNNVLHELFLTDAVVPIVARSSVAARLWNTPLSMVFIDGGHTFEAAFGDYNAWVSHLIPGGFLAIHDIFADSTQGGQAPRCIYNLALDSGLFEELPMTKTLGVLRRAEPGVVTSRARQRWEEINR